MQNTNDLQPIRGSMGATDLGPRNLLLDQQNPDVFLPPATDIGSIPNLKLPSAWRITGWRMGVGRGK